MSIRRLLIILAGLVMWASAAAQSVSDPLRTIDAARDVFDDYTQALASGDMGILKLYAKDARVRTLQIQAKGNPEYQTVPFATYAAQLRKEFSNPNRAAVSFDHTNYRIDGDLVVVRCKRHVSSPDFTGDFTLKIGANGDHRWVIKDQLTELPSLYAPGPQDPQDADMVEPLPADPDR